MTAKEGASLSYPAGFQTLAGQIPVRAKLNGRGQTWAIDSCRLVEGKENQGEE